MTRGKAHQVFPLVILLHSVTWLCVGLRSTVIQGELPSHEAPVVQRLHRWEHQDAASMLEAEARWQLVSEGKAKHNQQKRRIRMPSHQTKSLKEHHGEVLKRMGGGSRHFKGVSSLQERQEHDGEILKLLGTGLEGSGIQQILAGLASAADATTVHLHAAQADWSARDGPTVVKLSNLYSQYVGVLGMGTKAVPTGCDESHPGSLVYQPPEVAEEEASEGRSTPSSQLQTCHAESESQIWAVLDTGSTNFWVCSDLCDGPCKKPGRHFYDHTQSRSYQVPSNPFNSLHVEFGTGGLTGPQAVDDLHLGKFTVYGQTFGMIKVEEGSVFTDVPFEGILGLAFPSMSANGATPFFDNIIKSKALPENKFAFYFSLDDPSENAVFWGGVDGRFHKQGEMKYHTVTDPYYWAIDLLQMKIGGEDFTPHRVTDCPSEQQSVPKAIVDTGTTFFTADSQLFPRILSKLPETKCTSITEESHPSMTFQLRSEDGELRDLVLNWQQYMVATSESDDATCIPTFMQIDVPCEHGPGLIFGEVMSRHYFTVFDRVDGTPTKARIGLAPAADGGQVVGLLHDLTKNQPSFDVAHKIQSASSP